MHAGEFNHLFRVENDGTGGGIPGPRRGAQSPLTCVAEDSGLDGRDLDEQIDKDLIGVVRRIDRAG